MVKSINNKNSNSNINLDEFNEFNEFVSNLPIDSNEKSKSKNVRKRKLSNKHIEKQTQLQQTQLEQLKKNKLTKLDKDDIINSSLDELTMTDSVEKGIIYARCSSIRQTHENNMSLETQVSICLEYCVKNNIIVTEIKKDIVPGHDISKMSLNDIPDNFSNIHIIIADPSRLSRNVADADIFLKRCTDKKITIHFPRDNLISDVLNYRGKILGLVHDAYTETQIMSKRIKSSIQNRKKFGSYIGIAPFGYKINKIAGKGTISFIRKLFKDDSEQKIIEIIKKLYYGTEKIKSLELLIQKISLNNKIKLNFFDNTKIKKLYYGNISINSIVDFLNENNILKRGKEWTYNSVLRIINNLNIDHKIDINYDPNYIDNISNYNSKLHDDDEYQYDDSEN
jgi:DNA invertase Pin-like site-specific DNA recombinase